MSPLLIIAPLAAAVAWFLKTKAYEIALVSGTVVKVGGGYKLLYSGPAEDINMSEAIMGLPASTLGTLQDAINGATPVRFNNEGQQYLVLYDNADKQSLWVFAAKTDAKVIFENA